MQATDKTTVTQRMKRSKKWQALERFLIHLLIFLTVLRWVVDFIRRCL